MPNEAHYQAYDDKSLWEKLQNEYSDGYDEYDSDEDDDEE
jgi:hypothetical protein